ncbi:DUF4235 domain-containing protein, partial [Pseudonocardia sp. KRD291]|uniref:DUF4235 domain-containing protein n=1 Tax=Pseudonocardia sp. KRD291 TaxID=2792007 RepID=UPI001C4A4D53
MNTGAADAGAPASKTAKILYRPVGVTSSVVGGLLANVVVRKVWQSVGSNRSPDPPGALEVGRPLGEIVFAAALQGAVFAV